MELELKVWSFSLHLGEVDTVVPTMLVFYVFV